MSSQVSEESPFDAFPEEVREDVDGLLWLGYLEDSFTWGGHDFVIRTLRGDEELNAGVVTKEYDGTIGNAKAQIWATVALALIAVDGEEDFCPPIGRDRMSYARGRFQYVTGNWFWPVALKVYDRYTKLLDRQAAAMEAMEDLSLGSLDMSTPFAGSLIDRASSVDEAPEAPLEDIREFLDTEDD